jgi:hypothetical protein
MRAGAFLSPGEKVKPQRATARVDGPAMDLRNISAWSIRNPVIPIVFLRPW